MFGYLADQRKIFPDPKTDCLVEGVIALSHICTPEMLFEAYSFGMFPWPQKEDEVLWFSPDQRGVLFFEHFHVPKRLQRKLAQVNWRVTVNTAFQNVIEECAKIPRKHEAGTWITRQLIDAYIEFHQLGYAHSVECWDGNELIGGIYGVSVGGAFSGESMFLKKVMLQKLALYIWLKS
ncbi:MAG: leucyl/phenylalanyl-tRNA--protein transferase [Bdellovibrionales bacterium]